MLSKVGHQVSPGLLAGLIHLGPQQGMCQAGLLLLLVLESLNFPALQKTGHGMNLYKYDFSSEGFTPFLICKTDMVHRTVLIAS